jgi:prevent-host-death family protein
MNNMTIGMSEAKTNFARMTAEVNRTGMPVTVFKNNKPWVVVSPATSPLTFEHSGQITNKTTLAAMDEADTMLQEGARFTRLQDMMETLREAQSGA